MASEDETMYPLNLQAWDEWVRFRHKEKRKKIGPMAAVKQQKLLVQYPPDVQQEIIDSSIMNSWQGLFPPKERRYAVSSGNRQPSSAVDRVRQAAAARGFGEAHVATVDASDRDLRPQVDKLIRH